MVVTVVQWLGSVIPPSQSSVESEIPLLVTTQGDVLKAGIITGAFRSVCTACINCGSYTCFVVLAAASQVFLFRLKGWLAEGTCFIHSLVALCTTLCLASRRKAAA